MKLALGAVQFGLDYGITNYDGQVATDGVKSILVCARANGIKTIDTASSYGNSEKVLGEVGVDNCHIITKTSSLKGGINGVIKGFYQSLEHLNQKSVDGLLIHDINEVSGHKFNDLFKRLEELKQKGLVNKIGFSTYTPEQVNFLLENFDFDIVQLPFNVFDNRLIQGGQLNELKNKSIEVHARSVFLQGVLLRFDGLSNYFSTWQGQFEEYQAMVEKSGLSLLEYALNFALNVQEIDKVLVGVNSEKQLIEIVQAAKDLRSPAAFPINDINLLNPSLWKV
jgi:aryl-alcohol dehydrogenase-like predicted oxidoreductase